MYVMAAALALLLHLWNCCSHVTVAVSLCCATECTVLPEDEEAKTAQQTSDADPEAADCGKAVHCHQQMQLSRSELRCESSCAVISCAGMSLIAFIQLYANLHVNASAYGQDSLLSSYFCICGTAALLAILRCFFAESC